MLRHKRSNHLAETPPPPRGLTSCLNPQQLFGVELLQKLCVEAARLDGKVVQLAFLVALGQDVLLDGFLADQTVDVHFTGLTNTMAPVLGLRQQLVRLRH